MFYMKNSSKPEVPKNHQGIFFRAQDGNRVFIFEHKPIERYESTIYVISGVTGINHNTEMDIIKQLGNSKNRVVVIHPRGTGYSDGDRGDIRDFSLFLNDYVEIISKNEGIEPVILYGHSMSCAVLLEIAERLKRIDGVIIVNPPYILKKARGMSPGILDYFKYAWHYLFARHKPIVNMAGDPSLILNEEDRKESEERMNDPLLVKYFSLNTMIKVKKIMDAMLVHSRKATYPLLLLYGSDDSIVDKRGCDAIYNEWKTNEKEYHIVEGGSHGKSTVKMGETVIRKWLSTIIS